MEQLSSTAAALQPPLISKTRAKLLAVFLNNPGRIFYVRELVRAIGEQINAVRAELSRMEKAGMLFSESRANRKFYGFRKDYIFNDELLRLVAKTTSLGGNIIHEKGKLGKVKLSLLAASFMKRRPVGPTDVDLLIVGEIVLPQLASLVKEAENDVGREINYTVM